MKTDLDGKVILITGASGGIGSAIARAFAAEGAKLVLHYRSNRASAQALQTELDETNTLVLRADLTKETESRRLFAKTIRHFGRVDTLVANAGSWVTRDVPLQKMSLLQWRRTQEQVLTSSFLSLREFTRLVAKRHRGNAVLIGSTAAVFGEAGHADYAAAKAGLAFGLTHSLKNEIAQLAPPVRGYCGGRVNCVCPGWTLVPRTTHQLKNRKTTRKVTATMALPKLALPEDIARTVVFLASDTLAGHITGQTLVIAGGMEGRLLWHADPTPARLRAE